MLVVCAMIMVQVHDGRFHPGVYASPVASETCCAYYYGFNTTVSPTNNVHVRRALSYAVDRETLTTELPWEDIQSAKTFACPGIFGAPEDAPESPGIEFNPELAKTELELAGYPGGAGLPKITLMFNTSEGHRKIAEAVQAQWKEHLGIDVELADQAFGVNYATLSEDAPQIWQHSWCADCPDENNRVLNQFHSTKGANRVLWSNSEYDQIVDQLDTETDPARLKEHYERAERLLTANQAVIIPLFHYTRTPGLDLSPEASPPLPKPTAHAQVRFEDVIPDGNDKVVVLRNFGDEDADLTGWQVQSVDRITGEVLDVFRFPDGFSLPVGGEVRIHSGPAAQSNPPGDLLWTNNDLWNPEDGKAVLVDNQGNQRASRAWRSN